MRVVKFLSFALLVVFVAIQFIPSNRNESETAFITDFMSVNMVPENINNKLRVSCYDCHSNNTVYPWYNKIQPVSWFLEGHVAEGKSELNFSEWDNYSNRRKKSKLKSIISQINEDNMPLSSYVFIHGKAKLSKMEKEAITEWINELKDNF